eukprot:15140222-Alexandrium_andersonii.AAC.1
MHTSFTTGGACTKLKSPSINMGTIRATGPLRCASHPDCALANNSSGSCLRLHCAAVPGTA